MYGKVGPISSGRSACHIAIAVKCGHHPSVWDWVSEPGHGEQGEGGGGP
jgi:hypothetical protein